MALKDFAFKSMNLVLPKTARVIKKTADDIQSIVKLYKISENVAFVLCALYQLIMIIGGSDIWYLNLALLLLSLGHFAYKIIANNHIADIDESDASKKEKKIAKKKIKHHKKNVDTIYTLASISVRLCVIAASIYSIVIAPKIFNIICTTLISAEIIVEIIIRILITLVQKRYDELCETFHNECNAIKNKLTAPIETAKDIGHIVIDTISNEDSPLVKTATKLGKWFKNKIASKNEVYIENSAPPAIEASKDEETV